MNYDQSIISIKEQARTRIATVEDAGKALVFAKQLMKFAKEVEEKVKDRAKEIMDEKNVELISCQAVDMTTGEVQQFEARRSYGSITKEYRPENVIAALGIENAQKYLKVSKKTLETYLKKATAKGEISMEVMQEALKDPIEKMKKSSGVVIRPVK